MKHRFDVEALDLLRRAMTAHLWHSGAVAINLDSPFKLVSGNYSPIYVNCRRLISSPSFVDLFCSSVRILSESSHLEVDVIAGGETAGIPFAAFLAKHLGAPLVYVRKAAKEHGLRAQVEGDVQEGSRVLLVEDLITDAGSKLAFVEGLQRAGLRVEHVVVVFDREQGGRAALAARGIQLHALSDMSMVLAAAGDLNLLSSEQLSAVRLYLSSPSDWHRRAGLPFQEAV